MTAVSEGCSRESCVRQHVTSVQAVADEIDLCELVLEWVEEQLSAALMPNMGTGVPYDKWVVAPGAALRIYSGLHDRLELIRTCRAKDERRLLLADERGE